MKTELKAPLTEEVDVKNKVVHLSEYGEHLITLTFDDIDYLHRVRKEKTLEKVMQFFKKVIERP